MNDPRDEKRTGQARRKPADAGQPKPEAHQPSFGMSEGTREELERTGQATDPFTGKQLTRNDLKK